MTIINQSFLNDSRFIYSINTWAFCRRIRALSHSSQSIYRSEFSWSSKRTTGTSSKKLGELLISRSSSLLNVTSKVSSEFGFRVQELGLKSDFSMFQTWLDFKFSLKIWELSNGKR